MPVANSTTSKPRRTSPRASSRVLPFSSVISLATSSRCASRMLRYLNISVARFGAGVCDQLSNAFRAARTASSTSAGPQNGVRAITSPVGGLWRSPNVLVVGVRHLPALRMGSSAWVVIASYLASPIIPASRPHGNLHVRGLDALDKSWLLIGVAMRLGSIDVERRTQEIGRELFRRAREGRVNFSLNRWLDERLMAVAMHDEARKTQLFRLVDTLPALQSSQQINAHLREYLRLPHWPRDGWIGETVASLTEKGVRRLARGFIAATTIEEAEQVIGEMRQRGLAFTIDVLGEAVVSEAEAEQYAQIYRQLVEELTGNDVNVSVKLSSLDSQFDPIDPVGTCRRVRDRLRPILRAVLARGAFINFDMEQYAYKDVTLRIFKEILDEDEFLRWPEVGIAIQAYLKDSVDDLAAMADWVTRRGTPVWVRLVKGAYWDYETVIAAQNNWPVPVFTQKTETDANFERLTTFLLESNLRPAIATPK